MNKIALFFILPPLVILLSFPLCGQTGGTGVDTKVKLNFLQTFILKCYRTGKTKPK